MELERVLTKLRYDEAVSGYALVTNDGTPFLSFSLPDETIPIIKGTLKIHSSSLKLMNTMSSAGTIILARIDANWVLVVLFIVDETLGSALQKTQNVVKILEDTTLPPPPEGSEPEQVPTTGFAEVIPQKIVDESKQVEPQPDIIPLDEIDVKHGCIVFQSQLFTAAMRIDSEIYIELKGKFANVAMDVLMMVDGKRTVFKISEALDRRVERVLEIITWCVSRSMVRVECPKEQALSKKEIVELPLFEGDLKKARKEHRHILEQCDGTKTVKEIAKILGIEYFPTLQSIVPYRGKLIKMIKKTI